MSAIRNNDERVSILEVNVSHINETLNRIEKRFDKIETKMDQQFSELRKEISDTRKESWAQFRWIISFIIVLFGMPIFQNIVSHLSGK